ncbi:hypothetical protein FOL47_005727 [Perkinsus chesapeaki]|uniref:Uncharacterized protein n=1 Tax=Perkinsus chesapeaki TaxID=330153 RepID=A0A7J6LWW4_PERCH|nr:hypothetical protein FOL47_005727 [Perkinsus chesapeaki]
MLMVCRRIITTWHLLANFGVVQARIKSPKDHLPLGTYSPASMEQGLSQCISSASLEIYRGKLPDDRFVSLIIDGNRIVDGVSPTLYDSKDLPINARGNKACYSVTDQAKHARRLHKLLLKKCGVHYGLTMPPEIVLCIPREPLGTMTIYLNGKKLWKDEIKSLDLGITFPLPSEAPTVPREVDKRPPSSLMARKRSIENPAEGHTQDASRQYHPPYKKTKKDEHNTIRDGRYHGVVEDDNDITVNAQIRSNGTHQFMDAMSSIKGAAVAMILDARIVKAADYNTTGYFKLGAESSPLRIKKDPGNPQSLLVYNGEVLMYHLHPEVP